MSIKEQHKDKEILEVAVEQWLAMVLAQIQDNKYPTTTENKHKFYEKQ